MVSDIILQTNSIVEKTDLTQTQMNGKISNYFCFRSVASLNVRSLQMWWFPNLRVMTVNSLKLMSYWKSQMPLMFRQAQSKLANKKSKVGTLNVISSCSTYLKVASSRLVYYSILNSFGQRSQYISITVNKSIFKRKYALTNNHLF